MGRVPVENGSQVHVDVALDRHSLVAMSSQIKDFHAVEHKP